MEQFQKTHRTKVEIEMKTFEVDLGTCIERDSQRENSVGAAVVSKLYRQHILSKENLYTYSDKDESLPPTLVCELDHVIAIPSERGLQDIFLCENDLVHQPIKELLDIYRAANYKIVLLTQRSENYRRQTQNWLYYNRIEFDELLMYPLGIKGNRYKIEVYKKELAPKYQVKLALETQQEAIDLENKRASEELSFSEAVELELQRNEEARLREIEQAEKTGDTARMEKIKDAITKQEIYLSTGQGEEQSIDEKKS